MLEVEGNNMKIRNYLNESEMGGFSFLERTFSDNKNNLSIGLANIHATVPGIEFNKDKIVRIIEIFKKKKVNMAIFPEFCLAGYFWDNEKTCWPYMDQAVIEEHKDWMKNILEPMLDDTLQFIIFNNIRKGKSKKYINSTYIVNKKLNYLNDKWIYDKTFLPGIEKTYTETGQDDRLIIDTNWGKFGFTTCYDACFSQLSQEYSMVDDIDALIQIASWRGTGKRDYPGMNINSNSYYGDLWDMFMMSRAATNQMWIIACNAVGTHAISGAKFWGGSGIWAPSGLKLIQGSHENDELIVVHNIDIKGQRKIEEDDFDYSLDFNLIYKQLKNKRSFTRIK
jgi:predicted amidohydrolase